MEVSVLVLLVLVVPFAYGFQCTQKHTNSYLVIDNDAGSDDAMAIFLSLLFHEHYDGPELVGLTTARGNTDEPKVYLNNQIVLKIANKQHVPIYRGTDKSIVFSSDLTYYHGTDGLGDNNLTYEGLTPALNVTAANALIEASKLYEGKLIVVTLGPVTNVGLAVALDPVFLGRLQHLYVAAGHIHNEVHVEAEFNARTDAEAYHIIAENATPEKVTIIPFSQVKDHLDLSKEWRNNVLGAIDTDIMNAQNLFERVSQNRSDSWRSLDPAAAAVALCPDLVRTKKYYTTGIELCGDRRGITTNNESDKPNVGVVYDFQAADYQQFLLDVFAARSYSRIFT
ncbi:probable uridine nucleosidase 2 [Plutella xylostella]|uniref:probable uridine nucleosidase 2 n=1 Tax=Plutella xylostella TaxID=51655 RepID=UPI00203303C3|nr:probable uridine nucleosidase 2 [Plutella xylostella]